MIELLIAIVVIGVIVWLVETYIPMSPPFRTILRVVVVLFLIIWLLRFLGVGGLPNLR